MREIFRKFWALFEALHFNSDLIGPRQTASRYALVAFDMQDNARHHNMGAGDWLETELGMSSEPQQGFEGDVGLG